MQNKTYLGDSVYAEFDEYGALTLFTDNGFGPFNKIYIEDETWDNLQKFVQDYRLKMYGVKDGEERYIKEEE